MFPNILVLFYIFRFLTPTYCSEDKPHLASCNTGLLSSFDAVPSPIFSSSHHLTKNKLCGYRHNSKLLPDWLERQRTCEVSLWMALLTWQALIPSSKCAFISVLGFHNEGLRWCVSSCLRHFFSDQDCVSGFMKGLFAVLNTHSSVQPHWQHTNPTHLLTEPCGVVCCWTL